MNGARVHRSAVPRRPAVRRALLVALVCAPLPASAATLVVLNKADATASLIDLARREVVATLPTDTAPHQVAISSDGRAAVVTSLGGGDGGSLTVLDLARRTVARTIDLGQHRRPRGLAFVPGQARRVLVTAEDTGSLLVVDVATGNVVASHPTEAAASDDVVAAGPALALVSDVASGSVSAIELRRGRVRRIATGRGPEGIDLSRDRELWVANRDDDTVSVIDLDRRRVRATLPTGDFPVRVELTTDGKHAVVANHASADLDVFDAARKRRVARVELGEDCRPLGLLMDPDGSKAYVACSGADKIIVLDRVSFRPIDVIRAGREPGGMAISSSF